MSSTAESEATPGVDPVVDSHDDHDDHHPSDAQYIKVAIFLAVVTALEVWTYFPPFDAIDGPLVPILLIVMMTVKFAFVAAWFMHLRFDDSMFTRFFVTGIVLAVTVYVIVFTAFRFWQDGGL